MRHGPPVHPTSSGPGEESPTALAQRLLPAMLRAAGLPDVAPGLPTTSSRTVLLDQGGAEGTVDTWRCVAAHGPAHACVEVAIVAETSRWNAHEVARESVTVSILDRREPVRGLWVSSEAPFVGWRAHASGPALVSREWLAAWLASAGRRLD